MRGYSETEVFPAWAVGLRRLTEWLVGLIPDQLPPRIVDPCHPGTTPNGLEAPLPHEHNPTPSSRPRCHEIARALLPWIRPVIPVGWNIHLIDGHYGAAEHTWFAVVCPGKFRGFVLDPYAVGRLPMVQLIDVYSPGLPHLLNYKDGPARTDIRDADLVAIDAAIRPEAGKISLSSFLRESPSA